MGAIVLNGAKIGRHCLIGAGALVTQNMVIPDGSLAFGSPAKIRGTLTDEAIEEIRASAASYRAEAARVPRRRRRAGNLSSWMLRQKGRRRR